MNLAFTKMHGLGNDFIVVDCRAFKPDKVAEFAKRLCDRRFGIGADQMLLIYNSEKVDYQMRILNADGSEVEMCGNGIRCFAKYIWDRELSAKARLEVETLAGIIRPEKAGDMVRVDMGEPVLEGRQIPVDIDGLVKDFSLKILDKEFTITCVSMGNPHAVIVVDELDTFEVSKYGPGLETHALFPRRTNVEFIQVVSSDRIRMRVWERGAGETLACGTGAAASAVAAHLKGLAGRKTTVELRGGELRIEWTENNHVYMTGPAVEVFEGWTRI